MKEAQRYYVAGDGVKYPLIEAVVPFSFKVYRSDCSKATVGDPYNCLIAMGGRRHRNVHALYIGSGKDAYVIMKIASTPPYAVHYTIATAAARVRDNFDANKTLATQTITLDPPTPGRTMEHRSKLGKKRRAEIKAGSPIRKREVTPEDRERRRQVRHRPQAKIERDGVVHLVNDAVSETAT